VYVYQRAGSSWTNSSPTATLTANNSAANDNFGDAVSISGDGSTIITGAPGNDTTFANAGAAYVFQRSGTWSTTSNFTAQFSANTVAGNDQLGHCVAINYNGTIAVVGAPGQSTNQGFAYVYEKGAGWATTANYTAQLGMAGGSNNDFFAASVGMDRYGTSVVIGAPYKGRGFAYIFVKTSTWPSTETACISSSTGGAGLDFGTSVTFSGNGNKIIAGAPGFTSRQGQVFVFDKPVSGWATTTNNDPFVASDPTNSAYFGQAVMLSYDGNSAVVGANGTLSDTGSAYLFGSGNETASTVVSTTADTVNATDNVTSLREAIT
jgi:hypothetical protein